MTLPVVARLDLYPANLILDGVMYSDVRVVVTADTIYAWRDGYGGEAPVEFLNERISDFDGRNTIGWTITLHDDRAVFLQRSSGCGCGSRLRGYRPFPGGISMGVFN